MFAVAEDLLDLLRGLGIAGSAGERSVIERARLTGYNYFMVQVSLPPNTEELLRERAKANGQDVSSYAARLLHEVLVTPSVEELLAPFREQVEASGMTDAQLELLGKELQREVRQEKQARRLSTG